MYDSEEFETTGKIEDKVFWDNYGDLSEENRVYWENYSTCSEQIPEFTEPMAFFGTGDNFSEACPARWTTLQAVVSTGENPLPAEVRIKPDAHDGDKFFGVYPGQWSPLLNLDLPYKYGNPMQSRLRQLFSSAVVRTFAEMTYKLQVTDKYLPCFETHSEVMIEKVTGIVEQCLAEMCTDVGKRKPITHDERFADVVREKITTGYIAELCLDLTHTFRANKNWNWHGASVGASIGAISSLLCSLSSGKLPINFRQNIPKGVVLTGSKHGHHDVHYVEYMAAETEEDSVLGTSMSYLDHALFLKENHAEKVMAIMDKTHDVPVTEQGVPTLPQPHSKIFKHPTPRPTRAHTVDFAVTWRGVHLLDGECKDTATEADANVLVLHSLEQLAYKDEAVALLTTSRNMTMYVSTKDYDTMRIRTVYYRLPNYYLGPVTDIVNDIETNNEEIRCVPTFWVQNTLQGSGDESMEKKEIEYSEIDKIWKSLRSEQRKFIACIFKCIDSLCFRFAKVDLTAVEARRKEAFEGGFQEPRFLTTTQGSLKSRRVIQDRGQFWYNRENMGGPKPDHASLICEIGAVMTAHADTMSPELKQAMERIFAQHSSDA